jgi:hypothetical protein
MLPPLIQYDCPKTCPPYHPQNLCPTTVPYSYKTRVTCAMHTPPRHLATTFCTRLSQQGISCHRVPTGSNNSPQTQTDSAHCHPHNRAAAAPCSQCCCKCPCRLLLLLLLVHLLPLLQQPPLGVSRRQGCNPPCNHKAAAAVAAGPTAGTAACSAHC